MAGSTPANQMARFTYGCSDPTITLLILRLPSPYALSSCWTHPQGQELWGQVLKRWADGSSQQGRDRTHHSAARPSHRGSLAGRHSVCWMGCKCRSGSGIHCTSSLKLKSVTEERQSWKSRQALTLVVGRVPTPYRLEGSLLMASKATNWYVFLTLQYPKQVYILFIQLKTNIWTKLQPNLV